MKARGPSATLALPRKSASPRRAALALLWAAACDAPPAREPSPSGGWVSAAPSAAPSPPPPAPSASAPAPAPTFEDAAEVARALAGRTPTEFGERVRGVRRRFDAKDDALALTVDLCAGRGVIDRELFDLLEAERIPAAVFVSGLWASANPTLLQELAKKPHLSIENHGAKHRPCSVDGRGAFGAAGTKSVAGAVAEIDDQTSLLARLAGGRPRFYRPGTAHLDDVCAAAAERLGTPVVGYEVSDAGAGLGRAALVRALTGAKSGAIVLIHGAKPRGATFEGLRDALPALRARGVRFARLRDVLVR